MQQGGRYFILILVLSVKKINARTKDMDEYGVRGEVDELWRT